MAPKPSPNTEPGTLTPQERKTLLGLLEDSREAVLKVTCGLSDRQATTRPYADAWSIVDCVEHLAVSDEAILSLVTDQIMSGPADPDSPLKTQGKVELVINAMRDRSEKRKTFTYLEPNGRWKTLTDAVAAFQERRSSSIEYVQTTSTPLHLYSAPLGALGDLSAYQWLLMMAIHTERHIVQIQELASVPDRTQS